ncbi:RagB/SusD family nutrient uptake outer membrane protein [Ornithobacterium rhinotracheale]|uniref:RagB/SusD family nutrient uptake outer membrane protein n=1 Tax=Ornithobacterium rhinotracheale TaxID=28251 RepID=UPI00129CEE9A|nr:RagB/SusD family nutrient uptake outer membrane protein [Ornithobacterium rhinotracheale]MRJ11204.1 RagB/SusD family nutrient uptake outer membrane protein [Ornithobacterium rhinotracheale]
MKITKSIKRYGSILLFAGLGLTSCNYLDVIPPEQAQLKDATKDFDSTLNFLYTCYGGIANPFGYSGVEAASDEWVLPPLWREGMHQILYGLNVPGQTQDGWRWGNNYYRFIGQCYLFLNNIENARGVTAEEKKEWSAEANFLIAYYHYQTLVLYGPCPILDHFIPMDADNSEFPGRSHFDYVTDWIVEKLDKAAEDLPASRSDEKWGRATSTMAKALKARLLVHAASPLWNGNFPFPQWKNKNYETPGYGYELVSLNYDRNKWVRAEKACQEALDFATSQGGHHLYNDEELYKKESVPLPFVPNVNENTDEGQKFLKKVMLMRYLVTTRVSEGNKEIIWGYPHQGNMVIGSLPHAILKQSNGNYVNGYSGVAPVLNTSIEYFYTKNGKRPAYDSNFPEKKYWFQSANVPGRDGIITLNVDREPRFYAWFAFDDGDYGSKVNNGNPLRVKLRDPDLQGFNPDKFNRDNNVTGYFSQKYIMPKLTYNKSGGNNNESKPRPLIRLAELYLNLAECQAELGKTQEAISNLNIIRNRAGVPDLTSGDITPEMSLIEWVRNERFIELWGEGHRYYDVRRWMIAPETMGAGKRQGLNAYGLKRPSFEAFNTAGPIEQPFVWVNRMYFLPLLTVEVAKNPQLIQAPGY